MKYLNIKNELKDFVVFSTRDIEKISPGFHKQRLSEWQKKGYLIKISKKYYMFSDQKIDEPVLYLTANKLLSLSYVSLEMAMSYYNLIPEAVYGITSVTSQKTHMFTTSLGTFIYRHIKPELLFGYRLISHNSLVFKIAEIEKTVLDYFYLNPDLNNEDAFFELRFNADEFKHNSDHEGLLYYLDGFKNKQLKKRVIKFLNWIEYD